MWTLIGLYMMTAPAVAGHGHQHAGHKSASYCRAELEALAFASTELEAQRRDLAPQRSALLRRGAALQALYKQSGVAQRDHAQYQRYNLQLISLNAQLNRYDLNVTRYNTRRAAFIAQCEQSNK